MSVQTDQFGNVTINFEKNKVVSYFLKPRNISKSPSKQDIIKKKVLSFNAFASLGSRHHKGNNMSSHINALHLLHKQSTLMDNDVEKDQHYIQNFVRGPYIPIEQKKTFIINCHEDVVYAQTQLKTLNYDQIKSKIVNIPKFKDKNKKLLLLDLDNTIIYRCSNGEKAEQQLFIKNKDKVVAQIGIRLRPFLFEFLKNMEQYYNILVFSQAKDYYISELLKYIDPAKKYIKGFLSRSNCLKTAKGYYIKDLRILQGYDLKKIIMVDNMIHSFAYQLDNGVPIIQYQGNPNDQELRYIQDHLIQASEQPDIREFNKQNIRLSQLGKMHISEISLSDN